MHDYELYILCEEDGIYKCYWSTQYPGTFLISKTENGSTRYHLGRGANTASAIAAKNAAWTDRAGATTYAEYIEYNEWG